WRRWHVSLSSWFRDYVYIPLGGNRKGKLRKYLNLMITFGASGLWHGANWTYVVWGLLNGFYQIAGDVLKPLRKKLIKLLALNPESLSHKLAQTLLTFVLIDLSWVFFRASSISTALSMLRSMLHLYPWTLADGALYTPGLSRQHFTLLLLCVCVLIFADIMKRRGVCIRQVIVRQDYWFQALLVSAAIGFILLFGVWGSAYDAASFIYFQF
ncbi:MAG: MBOAT family O-acyltransferase, partial [Candidatus Limivicinus sp.]